MKEILEVFAVAEISKIDFESSFKKLDCSGEKKDVKIAKVIIQIMDNNFSPDMKIEHFILQSSKAKEACSLGNIIPVYSDPYENMSKEQKISSYREDMNSNISLRNFIEQYDKGGFSVDKRADQYIEGIWNVFTSLREEFINQKDPSSFV